MIIYTYIINILVPHKVRYQRVVKRLGLPKIMKNGQDVNIQMRSGTRCSR